MKPSMQLYGGVHDDPGSRQKFIEELAKQKTPPHFVAVEWEQSVFTRHAEWRPRVAERLKSCWGFLTREDCDELSRALAWEGDAYAEHFLGTDLLWLESGFQEAELKRQNRMESFPKGGACILLKRLCDACRLPPEPGSKKELIDWVWKKLWSEVKPEKWPEELREMLKEHGEFERDTRWAAIISKRSSVLHGGWIAVVVGWQHADPEGDPQRLRGLLSLKGFNVNSVRLGP